MTQATHIVSPMGPIVERRQVLAKVYALLIKLAEEAEDKIVFPDVAVIEEESVKESTFAQLELEL